MFPNASQVKVALSSFHQYIVLYVELTRFINFTHTHAGTRFTHKTSTTTHSPTHLRCPFLSLVYMPTSLQPPPLISFCFIMNTECSLRHKLKSSFLCFSGDLRSQSLHDGDSFYNTLHASNSLTTPCSPSLSFSRRKKSSPGDFDGHHRGRSRYLLSRIRWRHHRYAQSPDFSYDPSSYALNFEDDSRIEAEDLPFRGFASRLKHSPPPSANFTDGILVTMPREIVGFG